MFCLHPGHLRSFLKTKVKIYKMLSGKCTMTKWACQELGRPLFSGLLTYGKKSYILGNLQGLLLTSQHHSISQQSTPSHLGSNLKSKSNNSEICLSKSYPFNSVSTFRVRYYCRDSDDSVTREINRTTKHSDENSIGNCDESGKDTKMNQYDDPWIRSLLADIKQDFDMEGNTSTLPESPDHRVGHDEHNVPADDPLHGQEKFEYDYRLADDIEEFGYHEDIDIIGEARPEKQLPISLSRSENGVFELEELITLMEHLGAADIVSFPIPPEANFCDHMVVVTAKSQRHLKALTEEMLWVHRRKKWRKDPVLHVEGHKKSEWCAMDIGNIVLHIFLNTELRQYYDIESLWLLGPENDPACQKEQQDSFVLSAEDLFWLETTGSTEPKKTDEKVDG